MKKIFSLCLIMCMLVSMTTTSAFASLLDDVYSVAWSDDFESYEPGDIVGASGQKTVIKQGETKYWQSTNNQEIVSVVDNIAEHGKVLSLKGVYNEAKYTGGVNLETQTTSLTQAVEAKKIKISADFYMEDWRYLQFRIFDGSSNAFVPFCVQGTGYLNSGITTDEIHDTSIIDTFTNNWHSLTLYIDYSTHKCTVYLDSAAIYEDIPFNVNSFGKVRITAGATNPLVTTYIDNFKIEVSDTTIQTADISRFSNDGYTSVWNDNFETDTVSTVSSKRVLQQNSKTVWQGTNTNEFSLVDRDDNRGKALLFGSASVNLDSQGTNTITNDNKQIKISVDFRLDAWRYLQFRIYDNTDSKYFNLLTVLASKAVNMNNTSIVLNSPSFIEDVPNNWHNLTVYIDYTNKVWTAYIDSVAYAVNITNADLTGFKSIRITAGEQADSDCYIDNFSIEALDDNAVNEISEFDYNIFEDDFESYTNGTDIQTAAPNKYQASKRADVATATNEADKYGKVAKCRTTSASNVETKNWIFVGDNYTAKDLEKMSLSLDIMPVAESSAAVTKIGFYKSTEKKTKTLNNGNVYDTRDLIQFNKSSGTIQYHNGSSFTNFNSNFKGKADTWYHIDVNFNFDSVNGTGSYVITVSDGTNTYSSPEITVTKHTNELITDPLGFYSLVITNNNKAVEFDNVKVSCTVPVMMKRYANGDVALDYAANSSITGISDNFNLYLASYDAESNQLCDVAIGDKNTNSIRINLKSGQKARGYLWTELTPCISPME